MNLLEKMGKKACVQYLIVCCRMKLGETGKEVCMCTGVEIDICGY